MTMFAARQAARRRCSPASACTAPARSLAPARGPAPSLVAAPVRLRLGADEPSSDFSRLPLHGAVRPKLRFGGADDPLEHEADRVAETVMRMPATTTAGARCACGGIAGPDGECAACRARRAAGASAQVVARTPDRPGRRAGVPPAVRELLRSPGRPLDTGARSFMEPRFGRAFGDVRIHDGPHAAASAAAIDARAYTVGRDIVFGERQYAPATPDGRRLLAHELAHVGQQASGEPQLQRAALPFSSTMKICRWLLRSRNFDVKGGAIAVTSNARWEPSEQWQGEERPECGASEYHITPSRERWGPDAEYGDCVFRQGRPVTKIWNQLPEGEYYLTIWTNNTNPNCCLEGDIVVEATSNAQGETCTQLPPGPLEMLHDALSIAGLIPVLGAVPDTIDAGIYAIEGDWVNAGFSALAAAPIFGDAAAVTRKGGKFILKVAGKDVERLGPKAIGNALAEAKGTRRAVTEAEEAAAQARKRASKEVPKRPHLHVPGLPGCRAGSLHCPIDYLREEFADLFKARQGAEYARYLRGGIDYDLSMGRSLRRSQTILTGNPMYAQFMREVPPDQWSAPFRRALDSGRVREISVGGKKFRWPLDEVDGPWVVHHDPPLGWVTAEGSHLWHPMPYRAHDDAHKWWNQLDKRVKNKIPAGERPRILEEDVDIRDL
jgi:hypothetical protein